jgi:hypothetical protein
VFEIVAPRFLVILENNFQGRLCMFYSWHCLVDGFSAVTSILLSLQKIVFNSEEKKNVDLCFTSFVKPLLILFVRYSFQVSTGSWDTSLLQACADLFKTISRKLDTR